MPVVSRRSTDYVKYASCTFVQMYKHSEGTLPTGVLYNKFMTLLNRELKDQRDANIRLSHCWYRWGDEVVRANLPYMTWNHESFRKTTVDYVGIMESPPRNDDIVAFIDSYARKFIRDHPGREGMEIAVDEVYAGAPFEFQNEFRKLRENLDLAQSKLTFSNQGDMVRDLFENAMEHFPHKSFPDVTEQTAQFERVFDLALKKNLSVDRLQQISESYWFFFCYHLRLHRKCHENVSSETLDHWRSILPDAEYEFECKFQNYAYYLSMNGCSDPVIDNLVSDRMARLDRVSSLMDSLGDGE